MKDRRSIYNNIANHLSSLNDKQISILLESATVVGNSLGGESALLKFSDKNIFIKKIRLTDIERLPENQRSTKNLFHLPLYYQYGVGSTGFGAWRELESHILSTEWVITGKCPNFPCLYHWRVLPGSTQTPTQEQLVKLDKDVKYWNDSQAVRERLEANLHASACIILFLEYFPKNLYQWFGDQITQEESVINAACEMIEHDLSKTITFMKSHNFIHFDAHFYNILTDGKHLYFSDFGLAVSSGFELSVEEKEFFNIHCDYDNYSSVANYLHCIVTHYAGEDKWIESLRELMGEKHEQLPLGLATAIKRYAPTALLMDKFYRGLQKNKTTTYPVEELYQAWSDCKVGLHH